MTKRHPRFRHVALTVVCLALAGCGSKGPTRYSVSGTVTFEGQPVPRGTIVFNPASKEEGAVGLANIENGKFATQSGKGVPAGKYTVLVRGFQAPGAAADVDEGLPTAEYGPALFEEVSLPFEMPAENTKHEFVLPAGRG